MSQNLTDQFVADTYDGVFHSESNLPATGITPMYDGLGNRSDISIGRFGQGVSIHSTLITDDLKVGALDFPNAVTTTGNVLVASDTTTLTLQPFSTALPDTGVTADSYPLGDVRNIVVDAKGRVTAIQKVSNPFRKKDMGRTRVQTSPSNFQLQDQTLTNEWAYYDFPVDSGEREDRTYKAATFYIERTNGTALTNVARVRSTLNPTDTGGLLPVEVDPLGHHAITVGIGVTTIGNQFFSSITPHPTNNSIIVWLRETNNTGSTWSVSLQAVHY